MSTIRVDNFGPSAGGTTYSARGIAKAWVNFNGTGTAAINDSLNISSLTDSGTGTFDIAFTNSMSSVYYSIDCTGVNSNSVRVFYGIGGAAQPTPNTTGYRFSTYAEYAPAYQDCTWNISSATGDLA